MHDKGKRDRLKEIDTLMVPIMLMILFVFLYLQTYEHIWLKYEEHFVLLHFYVDHK